MTNRSSSSRNSLNSWAEFMDDILGLLCCCGGVVVDEEEDDAAVVDSFLMVVIFGLTSFDCFGFGDDDVSGLGSGSGAAAALDAKSDDRGEGEEVGWSLFLSVGFVGVILAGTDDDDDDDEEMGDAAVEETAADDDVDDGFGVTPKPSTRFIMNGEEDNRIAIVNMNVCKLMISFVMVGCFLIDGTICRSVLVLVREYEIMIEQSCKKRIVFFFC